MNAVKGRRPRWTALIATALILLGTATYFLCAEFLFLPFGFTRDAITSLPWYSYRRPVTIEYWSSAGKGATATTNSQEAYLILTELKGELSTAEACEDVQCSPKIVVNIKRANDGFLLFTMDGQDLSGSFTLQDTIQIKRLPDSIRLLIEQRLQTPTDGN